jgi:hypothetical protein
MAAKFSHEVDEVEEQREGAAPHLGARLDIGRDRARIVVGPYNDQAGTKEPQEPPVRDVDWFWRASLSAHASRAGIARDEQVAWCAVKSLCIK